MTQVVYDDTKQRAIGIEVMDAKTKKRTTIQGKTIFLNAATLGTTQSVLCALSKRFPHGLGNDSGVLGHYLMDHHFGVGASGVTDTHGDRIQFGRRPNGFYIPRYQNLQKQDRTYLRGFGYEGDAERGQQEVDPLEFGADLKRKLTTPGPWTVSMQAFAIS